MKVALVYDRINKWGGAERVLLALHTLFPDAPLYTAVYHSETAPWADVFTIKPSFLQHIPFAKSHHEWFGWLTPLAFESFNFDAYDLVISVTSADAKGIITKPGTKHICYCLTPTRYLWSHYAQYFSNPVFRFISQPVVSYLKQWDRIAATRPDVMIAISHVVRERVKKYYQRTSVVIYPPATIQDPKIQRPKDPNRKLPISNYYLVVSRLVPYKKIDIAIGACNRLGKNLIIIGSGSDQSRLKQMAGPTITFLSHLTDEELAWYYQHSDGLIMPQEEDFGLVALEAQSHGIPVISYARSGAAETILPGETGVLFAKQTVAALVDTLKTFQKSDFAPEDCKRNAARYSIRQFENKIMEHISHTIEHKTQTI